MSNILPCRTSFVVAYSLTILLVCIETVQCFSFAPRRNHGKPRPQWATRQESGPWQDDTAILVQECWGKSPLLIRNAFDPQETSWPSWEDIVELSRTEDGARLIRHVPGRLDSFTLELGPFERQDSFQETDTTAWTLVVNDVDRYYLPLSDWIESVFSFIPRWRRDDGQVSLAPTHGGIGPHVDNYDVFLIQMRGSRQWQLSEAPISVQQEMDSLLDGLDVRILQQNAATNLTESLQLFPGDVLYLPPRFVHCGTSLSEDCMTLSVGCRAPSAAELVSRLAEHVDSSFATSAVQRYQEEPGKLLDGPRSLTLNVKEKMKQLAKEAFLDVLNDDLVWDELLGCLVTESKRSFEDYPPPQSDDEQVDEWADPQKTIKMVLDGRGALFRAEGISFTDSSVADKQGRVHHRLYANGRKFEVLSTSRQEKSAAVTILPAISKGQALTSAMLKGIPDELQEVLERMIDEGFVYGDDIEELD